MPSIVFTKHCMHLCTFGHSTVIMKTNVEYLVVIPWARVVCLIYTPKARGPRVYISDKPRVHMVQLLYTN